MTIEVDELWSCLAGQYRAKQITYWGLYQIMKSLPELEQYIEDMVGEVNPAEHGIICELVHQLMGLPYKDRPYYGE